MRTYTDTPDPKDRWGTVTSSLDEAKNLHEAHQRLQGLGFPNYETLISRVGKIQLYTYQGKRTFPYRFCCIIHIGDFGTPIFLKDLPDVFRLMTEIGAHPSQDTLTEQLEEIRSELGEVLSLMREQPTTQDLEEVKQPLQEIVTSFKSLKALLASKLAAVLPLEDDKASPKNKRG